MSAYKLPTLQELLEAGVHFGHKVSRGHPRMKPYIYGARDGVHIIDLTKSENLLKEACEFIYQLGLENKTLLFVGTKKQVKPIVEEMAAKTGAPFLSNRWIGGFLTNFDEIFKNNIKKLNELNDQKEKGELAKYTKKEQLLIDRQILKQERDFKGVKKMDSVPDAVFIIDTVAEATALKEANKKGIKTVAICDSNSNPFLIDYPIPGNDDAIKSIRIITEAVASAYGEGKKETGKLVVKQAKNQEKEAAKKAEEEIAEELKEEVAETEEMVEKEAVKESERVVE